MHMETAQTDFQNINQITILQYELAQHPVYSRILCGAIAGVVAKTAIAPAEKVKMSFQVSMSKFSLYNAFNTGKQMLFREGFFSLWKGHSTTIVRVAPFAGLNFMFHDYIEMAFKKSLNTEQLPIVYKFIAGSFGGAMATVFTYPLDVLRVRLALVKDSTWWGTLRQGGLYQGLFPTFLGIIPYAGTVWCVKQTLQETYPKISGHKLTSFEGLVLNGLAGMAGQFVSYPLDVLRRRMQMILPGQGSRDPTLRQVLVHLMETEGLRGLFKGFSINLIKGPLAMSISMSCYDTLRLWISCGEEEYKRTRSHRTVS